MRILSLFIFVIPFFLSLEESFALCDLESSTASKFLQDCAASANNGGGTISIQPGDTTDGKVSVRNRIKEISTGAISLGALLAVGAIVWAGTQYTKSFGDDEKLKKAKSTAIYALIGLILMMASFGLVDIVINSIYKITS